MSNQIVISSGAKVRNLSGVLTATSGIVDSVGYGTPNGVATLDALGKVPLSQLPASVVTYLGTWNAATNTPTLTNGVGDVGDLYICNVAGTVNFGAGPITFAVGDWVIYNGSQWQKSAGASGTVTSVAVTESGDALAITGSPITTSGTINIGFAGTGSQYIKGDGTLATFPTTIDQAKRLITEVYNSTGATLTKGTVVYINGGQGNLPTVTKAQANSDATSAQTYGVVQSDITNMNNGFVVVFGSITDIDTQAYAVGTQLYLSGTTAGEWTSTKPSAPIHLVYVGIVVRSHPTQGVVEIRIQNGYELEELHDVAISAPVNNQGIFYNSSNDLWENKSIATALGYTPADAALVVPYTGATTNVDLGSRDLLTRRLYLNTNNQGIYARDSAGTNLYQIFALNSSDKVSIDQTGLGTVFGGNVDLGTNFLKARTFYSEGSGGGGSYAIKNGTTPSFEDGYTVLSSNDYRLNIVSTVSAATKAVYFGFSGVTATRTYTLPDASGTLALTSNLSSYVPYTGATGNVNLGTYSLTAAGVEANSFNAVGSGSQGGYIYLKQGSTPYAALGGSNGISAIGTKYLFIADAGSGNSKIGLFELGSLSNNTARTYTMPDISGTLALLEGSQTFTGAKTFSTINVTNASTLDGNLLLKKAGIAVTTSTYVTQFAASSGVGIGYSDGTGGANFTFPTASIYTYTFPAATGTIALTSDLGNYVTLDTTQTITGAKTFTTGVTKFRDVYVEGSGTSASGVNLKQSSGGIAYAGAGYMTINAFGTKQIGILDGATQTNAYISLNSITSGLSRTYTLPDGNGTLVLGTGTTNYLPKFTGASTLGNSLIFDNGTQLAIGTTSPTGIFDIVGVQDGVSGKNFRLAYNGTYYAEFTEKSIRAYNNELIIGAGTGGAERMRITSAGNVGIGTSSPAKVLDVYSSANTNTAQIKVGDTSTSKGYIGIFSSALYISAGGTYASGWSTDGTNGISNIVLETSNGGSSIGFGTAASNTSPTERMRITSGGALCIGTTSAGSQTRLRVIDNTGGQGTQVAEFSNAAYLTTYFYTVNSDNWNAAGTAVAMGRNSSTGRSINAGGTINASGADYAEYMLKAIDETINKGDIVGVNENGELTNIFADAKSFVVKSTNPSYVGGDTWGSVDELGKMPENPTDEEKAEYEAKLEAAREKVDRIAFSGQVPCNVYNAQVGDYIIPINDNGKISGQAVTNPTFEQYQISVGKVWKIMGDGRAWIAVKIG